MRQLCSVAAAIVVLASLCNPQMARPQRAPDEPARQVPAHPDLPTAKPDQEESQEGQASSATERAPRIELRLVRIPGERDSFGFYDAISGSPIPRIERNKPFVLAVERRIWNVADRVTLSNFRALTGPPWEVLPAELVSRWDSRWAEMEIELPRGEESVVWTLPTSYPHDSHRLIVFDVTVSRGDFVFTFTDPWDESPGYP
jgi:hypothetical protein